MADMINVEDDCGDLGDDVLGENDNGDNKEEEYDPFALGYGSNASSEEESDDSNPFGGRLPDFLSGKKKAKKKPETNSEVSNNQFLLLYKAKALTDSILSSIPLRYYFLFFLSTIKSFILSFSTTTTTNTDLFGIFIV